MLSVSNPMRTSSFSGRPLAFQRAWSSGCNSTGVRMPLRPVAFRPRRLGSVMSEHRLESRRRDARFHAVFERGTLQVGKVVRLHTVLHVGHEHVRRLLCRFGMTDHAGVAGVVVEDCNRGHRLSPWSAPFAAYASYLTCHTHIATGKACATQNNSTAPLRVGFYLKMMGEG